VRQKKGAKLRGVVSVGYHCEATAQAKRQGNGENAIQEPHHTIQTEMSKKNYCGQESEMMRNQFAVVVLARKYDREFSFWQRTPASVNKRLS